MVADTRKVRDKTVVSGCPSPFARKTCFRCLVRDHERVPETGVGLHFVTLDCLMLQQLFRLPAVPVSSKWVLLGGFGHSGDARLLAPIAARGAPIGRDADARFSKGCPHRSSDKAPSSTDLFYGRLAGWATRWLARLTARFHLPLPQRSAS